ncbi:MAG TPA: (2Fe-2S) ferredoxin domain-containing protein [Magnetovibrio sp.]
MTADKTLFVCINKKGGRACIGLKSREVFRVLHKRARERGGAVNVERITCMGYCGEGPNVKIQGGDVFNEVCLDDVERILDAAEAKG